MKKASKKLTAVLVGATVVLTAGIAFAAWTATGSGSGYAKATTAVALTTLDVHASASAQLYPTCSKCADMVVKFDNTNPYVVEVTSVSQAVSDATHFVSGSGGLGACTDDPATESTPGDPTTLAHPTGVSFSGYTAGGTHGDISSGSTGAGPNFPDLVVPANGSAQFTLTGTVSMDNASDNNCQGATFTIPVSFTGNSGD